MFLVPVLYSPHTCSLSLELQAFSIGNPDPLPKQQYRKKKDHGRADARALTGAEINERKQLAREAALAVNIAHKDTNTTPPGTPPQAGESPYQISIVLPTRPSPRQSPPQAPIRHLTLFPGDDSPEAAAELPASTAPGTAGRAGPWQKA
jgi:hypothetical protein